MDPPLRPRGAGVKGKRQGQGQQLQPLLPHRGCLGGWVPRCARHGGTYLPSGSSSFPHGPCLQDIGFYRPEGPAFHLDLFQIGIGECLCIIRALQRCLLLMQQSCCCCCSTQAQPKAAEDRLCMRQSAAARPPLPPGAQPAYPAAASRPAPLLLPPLPTVPPADCLPWCTIADGIHVRGSVNKVLVQQLVNAYLLQVGAV